VDNDRLLRATAVEAATDALTGLANRRSLELDLRAAASAATAERPTVLALFDLDAFKHYNDTFGHPAGDAVLQRLATRLEQAVAPHGKGFRMGGDDEFCVLAPYRDHAGVVDQRMYAEKHLGRLHRPCSGAISALLQIVRERTTASGSSCAGTR
jgi:diguanylate cyclase (GGDEF)-like protein